MVEIRCKRGACGVSRWDGESCRSMRLGVGITAKDCGVMELVKYVSPRWFGHVTSEG